VSPRDDLPECVRSLLHDVDVEQVDPLRDRDFLVERALTDGSWEAILWARKLVGDSGIRELIRRTRGRRLSSRQLRFWQVVLDLSEEEVSAWISNPARAIWEQRTG